MASSFLLLAIFVFTSDMKNEIFEVTTSLIQNRPKPRKSLGFLVVKIIKQPEANYGKLQKTGTRRVLLDGTALKER